MRKTLISAKLAYGKAFFQRDIGICCVDDSADSDLQINCGQSECPPVLILGGQ